MENGLNQIAFFRTYAEIFKSLDADQTKELLDALIDYAFYDIEPEFENVLIKTTFLGMKNGIDVSKKRAGNNNAKKVEEEKEETEENVVVERKNESFSEKKPVVSEEKPVVSQKKTNALLEEEREEVEEEKEIEDEVLIKKENVKEKKPTPKKLHFGLFKNVLLTEQEHKNLFIDYGDKKAIDYIERLSGYIASTGKRYKSHYATIQNWARKDGIERWSKLNNIDLNY